MIKTHLQIALRLFLKDKTFTFINVLGLASGLAVSLLIIMYASFEMSYEEFNPQSNKIVRLTVDYLNGGTVAEQDCETYPAVGPRVINDLPEAERFTRAYHIDEKTLKAGNQYFRDPLIYATDPTFFDMMGYPLTHGDQQSIFQKPYEVVLTKTTALKFFNKENAVGETIEMPYINKVFQVVGIVEDSPASTHLKFSMLISYPTMIASFEESDDNWNSNNTFTYIQLANADQYDTFTEKLVGLNEQWVKEEKLSTIQIIGQPMRDIHLHSSKSFEAEKNGNATAVYFLFGVALIVIILAIVNYINLSTSKSMDRAKEVGIRKVVGSSLSQLRWQFMMECLIVTLASGVIALIFMYFLLEPFKGLADLPASFSLFEDLTFWKLFGLILIISTLACGTFPAFILSSLQPAIVAKGDYSRSTKGSMIRKTLVIFQFSVTIFLLIQALTAGKQLEYMRNKDINVNIDRTIVLRAPHTSALSKKYPSFKSQILNNPQFESITISNTVPGLPAHQMSTTTGINLVDAIEPNSYNYYLYFMDAEFVPTMQVEIIAGSNFLLDSENENKILVNEETLRLWGLPNPIEAVGKKVNFNGDHWTIVGVTKNFNQANVKSAHLPIIFVYQNYFDELASIRIASGDIGSQLKEIENIYSSIFTNSPFEFFFLDQKFDQQFRSEEQFGQVFSALTATAILIACLGLFGLASFTVSKRTKEIGIRKVLGASVSNILTLLYRDLFVLIFISILVSFPITYLMLENWLDEYAYRISLSAWLFIIPASGILVIAFLTVFGKTWKVSSENPVHSLRNS